MKSNSDKSPSSRESKPSELSVAQRAYEQALPVANALSDDEVIRVTTNIDAAVVRAGSCVARVREVVVGGREHVPTFDPKRVDRFAQYTDALLYAQANYLHSDKESSTSVSELAQSAQRALVTVLSDLAALATRGIVAPAAVESIKDGSAAYEALPSRLLAAAQLVASARVKLGERTLTTLEEQQELEQLAVKLRDALAARVGEASANNKALAIRERIFTLFYREYAQLRRVVEYLRFDEGDADEVLPSIFVRSGRKNKDDVLEPIENKPIENKPVEEKPASPVIGGVPQDDPFVR